MTDGRAQWVDLLEDRRKSSDILWLAFHKWDAENYKFSLGRSAAEIREAVYADPAIEVCRALFVLDYSIYLCCSNFACRF